MRPVLRHRPMGARPTTRFRHEYARCTGSAPREARLVGTPCAGRYRHSCLCTGCVSYPTLAPRYLRRGMDGGEAWAGAADVPGLRVLLRAESGVPAIPVRPGPG